MRTIILARHAQAAWSGPGGDLGRPLTARGRAEAAALGAWLAAGHPRLARVVASNAERARGTAVYAAGALDAAAPLIEPRIYEASLATMIEVLCGLWDHWQSILLVGHHPGVPMLADWLAARPLGPLATGAALALEIPADRWADAAGGTAELVARFAPASAAPG